jgi:hypothetical protein
LTTHRLLLVPIPDTALPSPTSGSSSARSSDPPALQTNLSYVRQTEFYNGFMRSSAKITLFLGPSPTAAASSSPTPRPASETASGGGGTWTCGVCGMVNSLASHEASPALSAKCVLCGVAYSASRYAGSTWLAGAGQARQGGTSTRRLQHTGHRGDRRWDRLSRVHILESQEYDSM